MLRIYAHITGTLWIRVLYLSILFRATLGDLGPVSISEKTSFRKISSSLEAARFVFRIVLSFWNLTGTSAAVLPMCMSNFKTIRQFKVPISWLRDLTRSYGKTSFRILRRDPGYFHWYLTIRNAKKNEPCARRLYNTEFFVGSWGLTVLDYFVCNKSACVIHVTTVRTRSAKTVTQSNWLHRTSQLIYTWVQLCGWE